MLYVPVFANVICELDTIDTPFDISVLLNVIDCDTAALPLCVIVELNAPTLNDEDIKVAIGDCETCPVVGFHVNIELPVADGNVLPDWIYKLPLRVVLPLTLKVPSTYVLDPLSIKKPVFLADVDVPVPTTNIFSPVLFLTPSFALFLPKYAPPPSDNWKLLDADMIKLYPPITLPLKLLYKPAPVWFENMVLLLMCVLFY